MRLKKKRGNLGFITREREFAIYALFAIGTLIFAIVAFFAFRALFYVGFNAPGALSDFISLICSVVLSGISAFPAINRRRASTANRLRKRVFERELERKTWLNVEPQGDQDNRITEMMEALKREKGSIFLLEGDRGGGKTYTVMLLLTKIGMLDGDLLSRFKSSVYYYDCGSDAGGAFAFADEVVNLGESILIVDNAQRLSSSGLQQLQRNLETIIADAMRGGWTQLSVLTAETGSIPHRGAFELESRHPLKREQRGVGEGDVACDGNVLVFQSDLQSERFVIDDKALRLDGRAGECARLLKRAYDDSELDSHEKRSLAFLAILVSIGVYSGYAEVHELETLCRGQRSLGTRSVRPHIGYFTEAGIIRPFPLARKAVLIDEAASRTCRKMLRKNELFSQTYHSAVSRLYVAKQKRNSADRWFYLTACESAICEAVDSETRRQIYDSCVQRYNKDYVLKKLEEEIELCSDKELIFVDELADLRIETGAWKEARSLLDGLIPKAVDAKAIWRARLRLAEACHGEDAESSRNDLNLLLSECDDPYLKMQANYWIAHIEMETGNFDLDPWVKVHQLIREHPEWKKESNYGHIVHRATADYCRTYFLRGGCQKKAAGEGSCEFMHAIEFFESCAVVPMSQADRALLALERAHLIHYSDVYRMGIGLNPRPGSPRFEDTPEGMDLPEYIDYAIRLYDESIALFKNDGYKTWRTAQVRRDELSLCSPDCDYDGVIGRLDDFIGYSQDNNVNVFIAYAKTLRGKALAAQAISRMDQGNGEYESLLRRALSDLDESAKRYKAYSNLFGVFRAVMLKRFVDAFIEIELDKDFDAKKLVKKLEDDAREYNLTREGNMREFEIIDALKEHQIDNQLVMRLHEIVRFYPVVLQ